MKHLCPEVKEETIYNCEIRLFIYNMFSYIERYCDNAENN